MVIVIINHVTSVSRIIHHNIGGISGTVFLGRDFHLCDIASLGTKDLHSLVSRVGNINLAGVVNVDSQWGPEFASTRALPSKG
jgi:hypothetical protein